MKKNPPHPDPLLLKKRMETRPKVIVILGQTATGKSNLAVKISKVLAVSGVESEVISADSRQVYTELDIGTGKITTKEMYGIPHHLLDVANPKQKFTASEYKGLAEKKIKEIIGRGKIPILCGGTGFYIDAVTKGIIFPEVPPNHKLRRDLSKLSGRTLMIMLKKLDPRRAKNIDPNNKVRLIRAIEIAKALGKVPPIIKDSPRYEFTKIGLYFPEAELRKNIEKRVIKMFKQGLLKEIQNLKSIGVSNKRLKEFGFEYNDPTPEKVISGTLKYAKRQMTWFKRDKEIKWFEAGKDMHRKVLTYLPKVV